jgi:hypothetical protein
MLVARKNASLFANYYGFFSPTNISKDVLLPWFYTSGGILGLVVRRLRFSTIQ